MDFKEIKMAIVLDGMGSDRYPDPEIKAAIDAANLLDEEIILVGQEDRLVPALNSLNKSHARVRVVQAPDILEMTDHPVEGTRLKPQNSMAVGINLVKNGEASAFVTAGNTGAANFNAIRILTRIKGISRPALMTTLPAGKGKCVFIDMGANVDCRPEFLLEFALMGSVYARTVLGIPNPRVGLLSNGEEDIKGNQLVKDTHLLLKNSTLNFIGNVEPKEVFAGEADVIVVDGFIGNVFIKTSEAVGKFIKDFLSSEIKSNPWTMIGGAIVKPAFKKLFKFMDPSEVGAGLLLGVDGYVFVGHGRSDSKALVSAIRLAKTAVNANLLPELKKTISEYATMVSSQTKKDAQ
jgi:glycerol-3-phosphate acyltransferase PlsX